jgi:hypothetical protein
LFRDHGFFFTAIFKPAEITGDHGEQIPVYLFGVLGFDILAIGSSGPGIGLNGEAFESVAEGFEGGLTSKTGEGS